MLYVVVDLQKPLFGLDEIQCNRKLPHFMTVLYVFVLTEPVMTRISNLDTCLEYFLRRVVIFGNKQRKLTCKTQILIFV